MTGIRRYKDVDRLLSEHAVRRGEIQRRLDEFAAVPVSEYFFELAYCLLTPQSSAVNAGKAVAELRRVELLSSDIDPATILASKVHYIRFHNTKARRLLEAKQALPKILTAIAESRSSSDLRAWMVQNVKGLGWKEASHFLRNIGHRNCVILDRHILKNLKHHGVIRALPKTLTATRYRSIEDKFLLFATTVRIPVDELDLLFWSRETGEILK